MLTQEQSTWLPVAAAASHQSEIDTGVPAELTLSQAIFESAWGSRAPCNNCFGIKAHSDVPGWQLIATKEWFTGAEAVRFLDGDVRRSAVLVVPVQTSGLRKLYFCKDVFAKYDSLADCFSDHARIVQSGPYAGAWGRYHTDQNLYNFIHGVAAHYATDPTYREKITAMANSATVRDALAAARESLTPEHVSEA